MTNKEEKVVTRTLREMRRDDNKGNRTFCKVVGDLMSCISMINSIICYGTNLGIDTAQDILEREKNARYNYLDRYITEFGENVVLGLIENQLNDVKGIRRNVFTDSEGLSYSALVFVDD